jgi:hypothetical protein
MAKSIERLAGALRRSDEALQRAASLGLEVSEAQLQQQEGLEALVKARVAVHAFDPAAVNEPVNQGLKVAEVTYRAGVDALAEGNRRRVGLGISLITIVITMAGLWLAIRRIERPSRQGGL